MVLPLSPLTNEERLALTSNLFESRKDEKDTQPKIGDLKYENGILWVYTTEGWVAQEEEEKEEEEAVVEQEILPEPEPIVEEDKKTLSPLTEEEQLALTSNLYDRGRERKPKEEEEEIEEETINQKLDKELPFNVIDAQIAETEEELEDLDTTEKRRGQKRRAKRRLTSRLKNLNAIRDNLQIEINREDPISASNLSYSTEEEEDKQNEINLLEPLPSERFLNYDTSHIKTLDSYSSDPVLNKIAYDFFEDLGRTFWTNTDAGNIMHFFREEWSFDDLLSRTTRTPLTDITHDKPISEWDDEMKIRYLYMKEQWENVAMRGSSPKEKFLAVSGVGAQLLFDPANWLTVFAIPESAGGSIGANVATRAATQATIRAILLNSLKTKTLNTTTVKAIGQSLVATPAKTTATLSFGYGVTYDALVQNAAIDLDQQDQYSLGRTLAMGGLAAITGGTVGKVIEKTPVIASKAYSGIANSKVADAVKRTARYLDETSNNTLKSTVELAGWGWGRIAGSTFGKDINKYNLISKYIKAVRPFLDAINPKRGRKTISGTTKTTTKASFPELSAQIEAYFEVAMRLALKDLRKGIWKNWRNLFDFDSTVWALDDFTNSILAQAIRSTAIGGKPMLGKVYKSPITGNRIGIWSKTGDFTPSFKKVIEKASGGHYTVDQFKKVVLKMRELSDGIQWMMKVANSQATLGGPNKLKLTPIDGHFPRQWLDILKQATSKWNAKGTPEGNAAKEKLINHFIKKQQVVVKNKNGTINHAKTRQKAIKLFEELVAPSYYKQRFGVGSITNHLFARSLDKVDDRELGSLISNNVESVYANYYQQMGRIIAEEALFGLPKLPKSLFKELPGDKQLWQFFTHIKGSKVGWRLDKMKEAARKEMEELPANLRDRYRKIFENDLEGIIKLYQYTIGNVPRISNPKLRTAAEIGQLVVQGATLPLATLTSLSEIWIPLARVDVPTFASNMLKVFALQGKRIVRNIYNVLDLDRTVVSGLKVPVTAKEGTSIFSIQKGLLETAKETSREGKKIGSWLNNTEAFEMANKAMLFMDQASMQRIATLYSAEFQNKYTRGFQRMFFRANLLSEWTKTVELAAFLMGRDMIKTNLVKLDKGGYAPGSMKRYTDELEELGINIQKGKIYIRGKGSAKQREQFEEDIIRSAGRFARDVILNPKVNQETALWIADPRTAIFTQLLAYPFAFGNTVTKRFVQGMFKGGTSMARTAVAGSLMTMTGIIGNEWRTGGGRLPTPYDPNSKTMDYNHQKWWVPVIQGMRRVGLFAFPEYMYNIERNYEFSSWGDKKRPIAAFKGVLGPFGADTIDWLFGKKAAKEILVEKLPGWTAYPKHIQVALRKSAQEGTFLSRETAQYVIGYMEEILRERELLREIEGRKEEEEDREKKFKGGVISKDYPVPNVIEDPSERIDSNTGLPFDEPLERLGFFGGGLMNGVEDPLSRLGFNGGGLNIEDIRYETNKRFLKRIHDHAMATIPMYEKGVRKGKRRRITMFTSTIGDAPDSHYIVNRYNPDTRERETDEQIFERIAPLIKEGKIISYPTPEAAEADRERMYDEILEEGRQQNTTGGIVRNALEYRRAIKYGGGRIRYAEGSTNEEEEDIASAYFTDNPNDLEELRNLIGYTPPPEQEKKPLEWNDVKTYMKEQFGEGAVKRAAQQLPYLLAAAPEDLGRLAFLPYDYASTKMPLPNWGAEQRLSTPFAFQRFTDWASDKERKNRVFQSRVGKGLFTEKPLMPTIDKPKHTLGELFYTFLVDPTIALPATMMAATKAAPLVMGMTKGMKIKKGTKPATTTAPKYKETINPEVDALGFYSQAEKNTLNVPQEQPNLKGQQLLDWVYGRNRNQKNDGLGIYAVSDEEKQLLNLETKINKNTTPEELVEIIRKSKLKLRHRELKEGKTIRFETRPQKIDPVDSLVGKKTDHSKNKKLIDKIEQEIYEANLQEGPASLFNWRDLRREKQTDLGSEIFNIKHRTGGMSAEEIRRLAIESPENIFKETMIQLEHGKSPEQIEIAIRELAEDIARYRYDKNPFVQIKPTGVVPTTEINVHADMLMGRKAIALKDAKIHSEDLKAEIAKLEELNPTEYGGRASWEGKIDSLKAELREIGEADEVVDLADIGVYMYGKENGDEFVLIDMNQTKLSDEFLAGQSNLPIDLLLKNRPEVVTVIPGNLNEARVELTRYLRQEYDLAPIYGGGSGTERSHETFAKLHGQISLPGGANYREMPIDIVNPEVLPAHALEGRQAPGHWEHPDTPSIATPTVTDRTITSIEGKPTGLHIEEFQSQVHQAGPEVGYFDIKIRKRMDKLRARHEELIEKKNNYPIDETKPQTAEELEQFQAKYPNQTPGWTDEWVAINNEIEAIQKEMNSYVDTFRGPVQDIPFKGEKYVAMTIKEKILQAIKEGKDYITIANPKTILERWGVQVEKVDEVRVEVFHLKDNTAIGNNTMYMIQGYNREKWEEGAEYFVGNLGRKKQTMGGNDIYTRKEILDDKDIGNFIKNTMKTTPEELLKKADHSWELSRQDPGFFDAMNVYKIEPQLMGDGIFHYRFYNNVIPNVAKKVVNKLDPVGTKAKNTWSYETIEETENVFTIHITPAMKEKIAQQGGLSPYGYAHGGLVQQTLNRRRNKNLDRL